MEHLSTRQSEEIKGGQAEILAMQEEMLADQPIASHSSDQVLLA
jgi:hypothetical protein